MRLQVLARTAPSKAPRPPTTARISLKQHTNYIYKAHMIYKVYYSFICLNVFENDNIFAIFCRPLAINVHDAGEPVFSTELLNCFVSGKKYYHKTQNQFSLSELLIEKCLIWSNSFIMTAQLLTIYQCATKVYAGIDFQASFTPLTLLTMSLKIHELTVLTT